MALFRKFFYRKPPDGLLEISERVYVFDICFSTDVLEEDNYKTYMGGVVAQLREHLPDASFMVFNFREGERQSQLSSLLSEYDMTVMDYPRHYEGCPLLTMEVIHHFLRSSESWLSLGHQNVLLMHCERGGWPVLAFMLAGLLIYRRQYTGEMKTLDMIYKQAPRELLQLLSPLNPVPSQVRYLQYVSRRNVGSVWPPLDRALTLDCIILRTLPVFDGEGGCRPIFRVYGQDPFMATDKTAKVLFSTPKKSKSVRLYKQADCELVKIDVHCHIQGDVVLECISLDDDLEREEMMFRVMFNTAFIRSNILMLNRDEIDILWNAKDHFPKEFRAEVLLSDMDTTASLISLELPGCEEKDGLPMEAFSKVQEIFNNVDWLDPKADAALNVLQRFTSSNMLQEKLDGVALGTANIDALLPETIPGEVKQKLKPALENTMKRSTSMTLDKQSVLSIKPAPDSGLPEKLIQPQELQVTLQRPSQSTIISQRIPQSSLSSPVSQSNSSQSSPLPMSRYHSAPSALGITALLHDHASYGSSEVSQQVTAPPSPSPLTPLSRLTKSGPNVVSKPPPPPPPPPLTASTPPPPPHSKVEPPVVPATTSSRTSPPPPPPPPPPPLLTSSQSQSSKRGKTQMELVPPPPPPPLPPSSVDSAKKTSITPCPPPPPPPPRPSASVTASSAPPPPPPPAKSLSVTTSPPTPPPPPSRSVPSPGSVPSASTPPPPPPPSFGPKTPNGPQPPPPPAPFAKGALKSDSASPVSLSAGSNGVSSPGPPTPAPPFSAPFSKGPGLARNTSPRNTQSKKSSLKPLHWLKLTRAMQGSLWAETQKPDEASKAPEFDMSELESLFSAAVPSSDRGSSSGKSNRRASVGGKSDKVQLIDLRRAYNCEIMLTKVKIPLPDLMGSVLALDDSALDVDQVDNLIKFCPTKEEMELLKGYSGDKENLGKCEQFFLELMKVPRVEAKLRVFSFKIQFRSQVSDLRKNLNIVNSAAEEIRNSAKLKRIMQTILSLGNALNQGTARGSAIGFRLDSLLKLTDTRARNNKMTLMHYLCKVLADKLPELLDFQKDLVSLESASKIQLKYLAEEMQAISKGLEKVEQELTASENDGPVSQTFRKTLKEFLVVAEAEVRSLASLYSGVGRYADALALYFGEDPARCPFEQVVSTLINFVRMFGRAHEENCKQLELEKKKAQKEAENEKMRSGVARKEAEMEKMKSAATKQETESEMMKLAATGKESENEKMKIGSIKEAENEKMEIGSTKRETDMKIGTARKTAVSDKSKASATKKEVENEKSKFGIAKRESESEKTKTGATKKESEKFAQTMIRSSNFK